MEIFYVYFLYFICYGFLGWLCETVFCTILARHLVNRGFLIGPICPVYGFGALFAIILLPSLSHHIIALFFTGMLIASLLEYFTGYLLERLFNTKWWDYSHRRFNIRGRVCLANSVLFGSLVVIVIRFIHPLIAGLFYELDYIFLRLASISCFVLLVADMVVSVQSVLRMNQIMRKQKGLASRTHGHIKKRRRQTESHLGGYIGQIKEVFNFTTDYEEIKEDLRKSVYALTRLERFFIKRITAAFPKMRPSRLEAQLKSLRQIIGERR